jgi:hypothetical protein
MFTNLEWAFVFVELFHPTDTIITRKSRWSILNQQPTLLPIGAFKFNTSVAYVGIPARLFRAPRSWGRLYFENLERRHSADLLPPAIGRRKCCIFLSYDHVTLPIENYLPLIDHMDAYTCQTDAEATNIFRSIWGVGYWWLVPMNSILQFGEVFWIAEWIRSKSCANDKTARKKRVWIWLHGLKRKLGVIYVCWYLTAAVRRAGCRGRRWM